MSPRGLDDPGVNMTAPMDPVVARVSVNRALVAGVTGPAFTVGVVYIVPALTVKV